MAQVSVKEAEAVVNSMCIALSYAFSMSTAPLSQQERDGMRKLMVEELKIYLNTEYNKRNLSDNEFAYFAGAIEKMIIALEMPSIQKIWDAQDKLRSLR